MAPAGGGVGDNDQKLVGKMKYMQYLKSKFILQILNKMQYL